jgi:hypothetical protein
MTILVGIDPALASLLSLMSFGRACAFGATAIVPVPIPPPKSEPMRGVARSTARTGRGTCEPSWEDEKCESVRCLPLPPPFSPSFSLLTTTSRKAGVPSDGAAPPVGGTGVLSEDGGTAQKICYKRIYYGSANKIFDHTSADDAALSDRGVAPSAYIF